MDTPDEVRPMVLFIRSREELEHLLVTMHTDGWSIRGLARHFSLSRNTVRRILHRHQKERDEGHDMLKGQKMGTPRKSKLDPFIPLIKELLEKFPRISAQRIFEEIREAGYEGGISILRDRLQKIERRPKREPVIRFETEPGWQGQMDWSPYTIAFKRTGKIKVQCFSYILGFSRRQYIDFTLHRDFYTLIRRHQDAFEYFGGVPKQCLYDSEKTIVLRWEAGRPLYNPAFIAFITHYTCRPVICRRANPQTKGKIEAPFQYVEGNLLNGREFEDPEDLRAKARWWLRERSDTHIHDTTHRPPLELFMEQEKTALQPLPLHPYDTSEVSLRICGFDGFIEFETNHYSVPYEYGADILAMKATEEEIFIYSPELDLIARHERLAAGLGKKTEKPEHRGSKKVRYGLETVKDAFLALGDAAEYFLSELKVKYPRNCGFHARSILRMKEEYYCDDINKALSHAIRYRAFDSKAIERILSSRANKRTLESYRNQRAREELTKVLPQVRQRPLDEYRVLFQDKEEDDGEDRADTTGNSQQDQDAS
jgi:transposase